MPRSIITDAQWELVRDHLPGKPGDRGRTGFDNRSSLEGMSWVLCTGAPWRDLPDEYGRWNTVCQRFRRWSRAGVFERLFKATAGSLDMRTVQVDGTFVKVHQHAAGTQEGTPTRGAQAPSGDRPGVEVG